MEIKSLFVKISADCSEFNSALKNAQAKFADVGRTFQTIGAGLTAAVTVPLVGIGAAAIKAAMKAQESENLFEVSMGEMAGAARAWSEELRKQLGLNAYEVRENVGVFYNMFSSMGLAKQNAYELSTGLTKLAYDMASFYNLNPEEAFQKLRAGITGEIEPLKRLGILVDEASVKTYAYTHGIAQMGVELTQQQKIMARYGLIMEQTKNAQGDLERTADSPTNKLRALRAQLNQVSIELGTALLPAFNLALGALKGFTNFISKLMAAFNSLPGPVKTVIIAMAGLAAAAGPVLISLGSLLRILPMAAVAVKAFTAALGPLGLALTAVGVAAGVAYTQTEKWEKRKMAQIDAAERAERAENKLLTTLWRAAQQAGMSGEEFKKLTAAYGGNTSALAEAIEKGKEGEALQTALAEVRKREAEAVQKQKEAQEKLRAEQEKGNAAQETTAEQLKTIVALRKQLTDEIMKASLSETKYARWALRTQYEERVAQIRAEITDEKARNELLRAAREAYLAQIAELERKEREKILGEKIAFAARIKEEEDKMALARIEAEKEYQAKKQEVSNAIIMMSLNEKDQKLFALEQERQAKIAALLEEQSLTQAQKDTLIALWNEYYNKRTEQILGEFDSWQQYVEFVQNTIESTLTTCISNFLGAFAAWGEQGGSILKVLGKAFKDMANTAIDALKSVVMETLKGAIKKIAADKAAAIAHVIESVMRLPFPLNLAVVGGAIAAVTALFSKIKLAQGGIVTKPTVALIGEAGPEAVIPLRKFQQPALALAGAGLGGGISLTVNIYGDINNAGGIDEISERMASKLKSMIRGGEKWR